MYALFRSSLTSVVLLFLPNGSTEGISSSDGVEYIFFSHSVVIKCIVDIFAYCIKQVKEFMTVSSFM
jgi:hypothetical protein